jgi:carboxypeptidase T
MRFLLISALLIIAFMPVYAQDSKGFQEPNVMGRITVRTDAEMQRVVRLGLDLMEYREGDDLIFLTTVSELYRLEAQGFVVRLDGELTDGLSQNRAETFNGGYRTVEETYAFLDQMQAQYPKLAQVMTYGQSWQKTRNASTGYDLKAIVLTNRQNRVTNKPVFLVQGGIHARELVPVELASRFIQYLLSNYGTDADATWLLDEHKIVVIATYNPDGRKIAETGQLKRKNMNNLTGGCGQVSTGIDLNRNYSFSWGVVNMPTDPACGETWPGLTASSEPETQAVQALINSLFPDQRGASRTEAAPLDATGVFLDLHSTGNLVLYPWGEDDLPPPNLQLRTIARKTARYNGYDPIQTIQLYPTSGTSQDYAYGELGVAGFGMESGLGGSGTCQGFMPAYSCMDGQTNGNFWNLNRPALIYFAKLARSPYMTGEGPTTETLTATRTSTRLITFSLRAQITDLDETGGGQPINAAEAYVDVPPWRVGAVAVPLTAEDGSFNSTSEFVVGNVHTGPGKHMVYVRGRDSAGNWGTIKAVFTDDGSSVGDG